MYMYIYIYIYICTVSDTDTELNLGFRGYPYVILRISMKCGHDPLKKLVEVTSKKLVEVTYIGHVTIVD